MVSAREIFPNHQPETIDLVSLAQHADGLEFCIDGQLKGLDIQKYPHGNITIEIFLMDPKLAESFPDLLKNELITRYLKRIDNPNGWSYVGIEIAGNMFRMHLSR